MRLCYRGVEYDHNPPSLEVTESEIMGCYRGRPLHFSYVRHIPFPQPVAELTYRGVAYRTLADGGIESVGQAHRVSHTDTSSHRPINAMAETRKQLLIEATRTHRENIQRSLEHRLRVAKAQGNELLVRQLEEEMHQIA